MEELRRAIAINPRNAPAQHLLGELLFKSGDTKAALEHYDRMAVLFRPDYVTLVNGGLLASRRGETAKSLERFEAALRLTPHDSTIHLYLGQALETSGDLSAAARQYALYISLHDEDLAAPNVLPNYLHAGMKLAELSLRGNHRNDAISLYRRIAQVARENGRPDDAALAEANLGSLVAKP
jgi:tetratricopeptide (TPR) repeat protein